LRQGVAVVQIADFKTVVFRQKQLGFNAVRLPFTFSDLNLTPKSWTKSCTDDTASLMVTSSLNADALKLGMYVGRYACRHKNSLHVVYEEAACLAWPQKSSLRDARVVIK